MKRIIVVLTLNLLLLCWCSLNNKCPLSSLFVWWCPCTDDCLPEDRETGNTEIKEDKLATRSEEVIDTFLHLFNDCNYHDNSKTFIAYAILWTWLNEKWRTEYYLVVNGQWYYLDERWNISNECWFGGIPTKITIDETNELPSFQDYETAKDWTEYDSSTKELFSDKAYKIRKDAKYKYNNTKSFLEQAEEYYDTKIIPEWNNNFECTFCDKLRYYEQTPEDDEKLKETNDLYFDYVADNNWNNTIYFWSDWTFEAKWSRDEWKWTWVFWKNKNTVIVSNSNAEHVYDRYIIINQDENNLNTILEIIQK